MGIILIILSFGLTKLILPSLTLFLIKAGAVKKNYLGVNIPISLGLGLLLGSAPSFFILGFIEKGKNIYLIFLILTLTLLVGFIDDLLGNDQVKGLNGHLQKLFYNKELTSGGLKAVFISIVSLFFALFYGKDPISFGLNFIILVLTTNTFNLLDLRPGRTIKVYILGCVLIFFLFFPNNIYLGIILASIIAYAPLDFKGKAMLGDAGSNFLGISFGIALVINFSYIPKIIISILLIILHIYTEKKSLTSLIEQVEILRLIDNIGRR